MRRMTIVGIGLLASLSICCGGGHDWGSQAAGGGGPDSTFVPIRISGSGYLGKKADPSRLAGLSREDQVRFLVFEDLLERYEQLYKEPDPSRLNAFYIEVRRACPPIASAPPASSVPSEQDFDPSPSLLAAIGKRKYPIKKVSECARRMMVGNTIHMRCLDRITLEPGYILWVGEIKWVDANTAELEAGHWEHGMGGHSQKLRVHWRDGTWQIEHTLQYTVS